MSEDFDWDDVDIVVPEQGAIAVYDNPFGNIVVRERVSYPEDDKWIVFLPQYAEVIVRRIIEVADLPFTLVPNGVHAAIGSSGKAKDGTAAERQRRRRKKLQNDRDSERDDIDTVTGVTAAQPPVSSDRAQLVFVRSPAEEKREGGPKNGAYALTEPPRSVSRRLRDCGSARWLPPQLRYFGRPSRE